MNHPTQLLHSSAAAPRVFLVRTLLANVALIGSPGRSSWVLVDAGVRGYAEQIRAAAEECFGPGTRPEAIVLTHGHFDHVGSLEALLEMWDVPVYAHEREFPHLTGAAKYPPPDPMAGGGFMAWSSRAYPRGPIQVGPRLRALPADHRVPGLDDWQWIHTPGHTNGHVSLFRSTDRVIVAGDAVTTVKPESISAVVSQRPEVHGPPAYFTSDWDAARDSVQRLAALAPEVIATGHGVALRGPVMRSALNTLAAEFDRVARPKFGRYSRQAAQQRPDGHFELPPDPLPMVAGAVLLVAAAGILLARAMRDDNRSLTA